MTIAKWLRPSSEDRQDLTRHDPTWPGPTWLENFENVPTEGDRSQACSTDFCALIFVTHVAHAQFFYSRRFRSCSYQIGWITCRLISFCKNRLLMVTNMSCWYVVTLRQKPLATAIMSVLMLVRVATSRFFQQWPRAIMDAADHQSGN